MSRTTLVAQLQRTMSRQCGDMAIDFAGRIYTWQFVHEFNEQLGHCLEQLGTLLAERVGFVAHTRAHHVACLWGLLAHQRVPAMVYGYQSPEKIAADIRQLRLPVVIADTQDWNEHTLAAAREVGTQAIGISEAGVSIVDLSHTVASLSQHPVLPGVAVETLSSGTTGTPKRIRLSLENLQASAQAAVASIRNMQGDGAQSALIIALPLANISGIYAVTPPALMGNPIALMEKFDVDIWLEFVRRYRPSTADIPPAAMSMLMQRGVDRETLAGINVVRTGAAPLDRKVHDYFVDTLGIPVNLSYGASEFCGVVTTWTSDDLERFGDSKRGSCGRPLPGVSLRVIDRDSGEILGPNRTGILEVNADRVGPDWVRTSDLARLDDQGFMWFVGRDDDTIFRGGFKLAPEAIAETLRAHPAIADAGVVGVADERLGEVPVAALVLAQGAVKPDAVAMKAFCRRYLNAQQIPVDFFWLEAIPRTSSLKLHTVELKQQMHAKR